ncbi:MAG: hypothetical protein AAF629_15930 [Chloroflexota bacterium]
MGISSYLIAVMANLCRLTYGELYSSFVIRHLSFALLACLVFVSHASVALAQNQTSSVTIRAEIGFDGYVKSGIWTPVQVIVANTGQDLTGDIVLQADYPVERYSRPLSLPSQSQKEIWLFAPLSSSQVTVSFVQDDATLAFDRLSPRSVAPESLLVGVVSQDPSLLNFLAGLPMNNRDPVSVAHLALSDLVPETQGLAALDVLIFNDIDTGALSTDQRTNLASWVASGGHLVVGGGPNGQGTTAGIQTLMPFDTLTATTLPELSALAGYIGEAIPDQGPYLAAVPQGTTPIPVIDQDGDSLLVRHDLGQGRVTYFALDFGLAPMNGWAGNTAFWESVLAPMRANTPFYSTYEANQSFNNALANIDVAALPSPATLATFMCLYLLVLVPVNYFVLRWFKRREWAWLTIPILILIFSLIGYVGGFRARGGQALLRQISVVQQPDQATVEQLGITATVDTYVGLYSPNRDRYTLVFGQDFLAKPTDTGSGSISGNISNPTTVYYGQQTELQNLSADIGTMATGVTHGYTEPQAINLDLAVMEQGSRWQVSGMIENNSGRTLADAILIVADHGLQLGELAPGDTAIDSVLRRLDTSGPYGDTTIWGKGYYILEEATPVVQDQMIRALIWPSDPYYGQSHPTLSSGSNDTPTQITLLGWQIDGDAIVDVAVKDHQVDEEAMQLFVIRDGL